MIVFLLAGILSLLNSPSSSDSNIARHISELRAKDQADVLFVPGQPRTRKIFQRDESGKILGFVDRREGVDLVRKVDGLAG